jgi:hypothetical protein
MTCLDENTLLLVHQGEATEPARAHAAACATCTRALAAIARDLGRVDAVLRAGVATRRRARPALVRWAPIAVAAVLLVALALGRYRVSSVAEDDDTLAMLDELTTEVASYETAGVLSEADDEAGTARSTCAFGEPFLEMGCDEPPATLVAWR